MTTGRKRRCFLLAFLFTYLGLFGSLSVTDLAQSKVSKTLICVEIDCITELNNYSLRDRFYWNNYTLHATSSKRDIFQGYNLLGQNSIHFQTDPQGEFALFIPYYSGKNQKFFNLPLNPSADVFDLQIDVIDSKILHVYLDSKLVHVMRYNNDTYLLGRVDVDDLEGKTLTLVSRVTTPSRFLFVHSLILFFSILVLVLVLFSNTFANELSIHVGPKWVGYGILLSFYLLAFVIWWMKRIVFPDVVTWANDTPFAQAGPRFSDFYQVLLLSRNHNSFEAMDLNYPASSLWLVSVLSHFPSLTAFVIFLSLSLALILSVVLFNPFLPSGMKIMMLFSFPLLFAVDRGNLDLLACGFTLTGLAMVEKHPRIAGTLFGLACGLKLWPLVLIVVILLKRKSLKVYASTFITFSFTIFMGIRTYGAEALRFFPKENFELTLSGFTHNLSLNGSLSLIYAFGTKTGLPGAVLARESIAIQTIVILIGIFLVVAAVTSKSLQSCLFYASGIILVIPNVTYTYRGVALLVPIFAGYLSSNNQNFFDGSKINTIVLALVLSPMAFWYASNSAVGTDSVITPSLIIILMLLVLKFDLTNKNFPIQKLFAK